MDQKHCSKCYVVKPLSEFYRKAASKDGRRPDCKACKGKPRVSQEEKFWRYVDVKGEDDCWPWTRSTATNNGYGRFWLNGTHVIASRYAYEVSIGPIPDGMEVCHSCDNPPCCNPAHFFLGTHRDNMQDALEKGRLVSFQGESHPGAKLSRADVREIRRIYSQGKQSQAAIAKRYCVSSPCISKIIRGEAWEGLL